MKKIVVLLIGLFFMQICSIKSQVITEKQLNFLKSNSVSIAVDAPDSSHKWEGIKDAIKDKRFILIGEFTHGAREIFLLRNELIKFLHSQLGYEVILFESGIGELIYSEMHKHELSPLQMTYGLFGGWRTSEFGQLMEYVKSEGLSIAGFDVQRTGGSFTKVLDKMLLGINADSLNYHHLEQQFGVLKKELANRKIPYDGSVQLRTTRLIKGYENLYSKLLNIESLLPLKKGMLALKTLKNRIGYLNYMLQFKKDKDWSKRWAARDSLMAENVSWLSETIYRNKKIIIVGHNYHISKHNEKENVMGEFLKKAYPEEMYSIGIYAKEGKFLNNYGQEEEMKKADTQHLDIKHIIEQLDGEITFIDVPKAPTDGDGWLRQAITINDTFINLSHSNSLTLAKCYDGLFLLKKVSVPIK